MCWDMHTWLCSGCFPNPLWLPPFSQVCKCCCLATCGNVLWVPRSAISPAAPRVSSYAGRMTAGATVSPVSQNATAQRWTSRQWKTACSRSRMPGTITIGSLRSRVRPSLLSFIIKNNHFKRSTQSESAHPALYRATPMPATGSRGRRICTVL